MFRFTIPGLILTAVSFVTQFGQAQENSAPANPEAFLQAMKEAAEPGAEHEKLQALAGEWTYTGKFWMEPGQPPIETKGRIRREWILGGRFLTESIEGTGFDGKPGFEAFGMLGYDKNQNQYTSTWACSMGTATSKGVGQWNTSGGFTFRSQCYCPLLKKEIPAREEIKIVSDDKIIVESYTKVNGEDSKTMEIIAVRKK